MSSRVVFTPLMHWMCSTPRPGWGFRSVCMEPCASVSGRSDSCIRFRSAAIFETRYYTIIMYNLQSV
jgi:hypothetical protein